MAIGVIFLKKVGELFGGSGICFVSLRSEDIRNPVL